MIQGALDLFADQPLILTDRLANSIYFNPGAEALFAERGEALVNRVLFSLLGLGERSTVPPRLVEALDGSGAPWKGVVQPPDVNGECAMLCEVSAIGQGEAFLCGMVRLRPLAQSLPKGETP